MPTFTTEVTHQLSQQEAMVRLDNLIQQVAQKFEQQLSAVDCTWTSNVLGFSLTTKGVTVKGTMTVHANVVQVHGKLPLVALPFRGTIQQSLAQELTQALG
jgi:monoamine oxidase